MKQNCDFANFAIVHIIKVGKVSLSYLSVCQQKKRCIIITKECARFIRVFHGNTATIRYTFLISDSMYTYMCLYSGGFVNFSLGKKLFFLIIKYKLF